MRGYIYGKDATFSGALFLEMVINLNKPVSQIIQEIKDSVHYDYHASEDFITLNVDAAKVLEYMRENKPKLSKHYQEVKVFGRNMKFLFEDRQWLLLRLSGTEPAFRIFAEFKNEQISSTLVQELKNYINRVQDIVADEMGVKTH